MPWKKVNGKWGDFPDDQTASPEPASETAQPPVEPTDDVTNATAEVFNALDNEADESTSNKETPNPIKPASKDLPKPTEQTASVNNLEPTKVQNISADNTAEIPNSRDPEELEKDEEIADVNTSMESEKAVDTTADESSSEQDEEGISADEEVGPVREKKIPNSAKQKKKRKNPMSNRKMFCWIFGSVILVTLAVVLFFTIYYQKRQYNSKSSGAEGTDNNIRVPTLAPIRPGESYSPTTTFSPTDSPTLTPPTLAPTENFIDPLMEFLEDSQVSFDRDPSSPNFKAVKWLADEAQIGSTADGVNSTYGNGLKLSPRLIQRFALLTLQFALESSDGFAVKYLDECQWGGVTCADVGNRTGYVNEINFSYSGMTGTIPPEIKLLKDLVKLDLSNNNLQGSIPEALYRLTGLEEITLFKNQLTGKLSSSLGNLWSLNRLHLSHNELSGSIPNSFKSGQIIRPIQFLSLYSNKFSGTIPNDLRFRQLRYADLARNQFSGTIPDDIGEKWVWGRYIWLDHNKFTGTIPDSFAGMGNGRVEILTFNNNKLSGTVPGQFYNNKLLEFNVDNNMFTRIDSNLCYQSVFEGNEMVEFKAECDICICNPFCKNKCAEPTNKPTSAPTRAPTKEPTEEPTEAPTPWTTDEPSPYPSDKITNEIVGL